MLTFLETKGIQCAAARNMQNKKKQCNVAFGVHGGGYYDNTSTTKDVAS